ncbi:MAG: hypothetical protein PQ975_01880 [Methanobacterium sp.]|jgi:fucose permease
MQEFITEFVMWALGFLLFGYFVEKMSLKRSVIFGLYMGIMATVILPPIIDFLLDLLFK